MLLLFGKISSWIFKNPLPVLAILVAAFISFQMYENGRIKAENAQLEAQVETIQQENKDTKENLEKIDILQQQSSQIRNTQTIIRERIRDVPVNEEDRPFANNPGLLDRIDVMRDYQQSYRSRSEPATDEPVASSD